MKILYAADAAEGLALQEGLASSCYDRAILLVWRAPPALIVGRGDTRLANFARAAQHLAAEGWPVLVRNSGGGACPISDGTLQIAIMQRAQSDVTLDAGFRALAALIGAALAAYGLVVRTGECSDAFCPGRYDLSLDGRKIAGLSQHWRNAGGHLAVTTAASLVVDEEAETLTRPVSHFYDAAGGTRVCRAEAVGSVRLAQGGNAPDRLALMAKIETLLAEAADHLGVA